MYCMCVYIICVYVYMYMYIYIYICICVALHVYRGTRRESGATTSPDSQGENLGEFGDATRADCRL